MGGGDTSNARSRSEAPGKGSVGGATIDSQEGKDSHPSGLARDRSNPNRAIFLSNADNQSMKSGLTQPANENQHAGITL